MPVPHPFPPNNMDRLTEILIALPRLEEEASHVDQALLTTEARQRHADLCEHLTEARRAVADTINALGGPLGVQPPGTKRAPKQQAKA
jgi:hypothetical protein